MSVSIEQQLQPDVTAAIAGDTAPAQTTGRDAPAIGTMPFGKRSHLAVEPRGPLRGLGGDGVIGV